MIYPSSRIGPMTMTLQTFGYFYVWLVNTVVQAVIESHRVEHFAHHSWTTYITPEGHRIRECSCGYEFEVGDRQGDAEAT